MKSNFDYSFFPGSPEKTGFFVIYQYNNKYEDYILKRQPSNHHQLIFLESIIPKY